MCLVTKLTSPIITKEPITCYKVLWRLGVNQLRSYFHSEFEWEMDKVHATTLHKGKKLENGLTTVYQGFHSYKDLQSTMRFLSTTQLTSVAVECIIPKGAKYYDGEDGDHREGYASDKLIPIKVMNLDDLIDNFYGDYPYKKGYLMMIESKRIPSNPETYKITSIYIYDSHITLELESTARIPHLYYMETDYEGNPLSKDESIIAYGKDSPMNPGIIKVNRIEPWN